MLKMSVSTQGLVFPSMQAAIQTSQPGSCGKDNGFVPTHINEGGLENRLCLVSKSRQVLFVHLSEIESKPRTKGISCEKGYHRHSYVDISVMPQAS
jgi:hypothetical protein